MELRCKAVMKRDDDAWRLFLDSALVVDLIGRRSLLLQRRLSTKIVTYFLSLNIDAKGFD
jgi:hypothetical protein